MLITLSCESRGAVFVAAKYRRVLAAICGSRNARSIVVIRRHKDRCNRAMKQNRAPSPARGLFS
jgi:hypothetical protein